MSGRLVASRSQLVSVVQINGVVIVVHRQTRWICFQGIIIEAAVLFHANIIRQPHGKAMSGGILIMTVHKRLVSSDKDEYEVRIEST